MSFSVIIPCHNAQRWIASTLASVAAQTLQPLEIIVVADRCTDDSVKVVRQSGLPIQLIEVDLGHAGQARNAGVAVARGRWIALLDADDCWYPTHLANAASLLADSDQVAYCSRYDLMDNQGSRQSLAGAFPSGTDEPRTRLTHGDYLQWMSKRMPFGHSTVVYGRKRFHEVGGFDAAFVRRHDIHLWLRMIHEHRWAFHSQLGVSYRHQTPGAISRNRVEVVYYETLAMLDNQKRYDDATLDRIIQGYAKLAMSVAFHDADRAWAGRLRELAWGRLPWCYRAAYAGAGLCPWLFKAMVRLKRRRRVHASL